MNHSEAQQRYSELVAAVKAAVDAVDPIGVLTAGAPSDEYEAEVGTIVARVAKAVDVTEAHRIVHDEFGRWFGVDRAGPLSDYEATAREIWRAVLSFRREG